MADLVGKQLGNYRLITFLGKGAFADVYEGVHVLMRSQAAIKVLRALSVAEQAILLNEAQIIAGWKHHNIVRLLEFGLVAENQSLLEKNQPFLVMEYAPWGSLRRLHPKGKVISLGSVLYYVTQTAAGLQYAHEHHVIHRDVKPENILIGAQGEVLLTDFGLAIAAQSSRQPRSPRFGGTPAYMAPEQFVGAPCPASDQYALGVMIYEWLTGEQPLRGLLQAAPPSPLRKINPAVPPTVEEVVLMALAYDPAERFASMSAFATAFATACQTAPEQLSLGTQPMGVSAPIPPAPQPAPITPPNPTPPPGYSTRPLPTALSFGGLTTRPQPTEPGATASGPVAPGLPMQPPPAAPMPFGRPASGPAPVPPHSPETPGGQVTRNVSKRRRRAAILSALVAAILLAALAGGVLLAQKLGSPTSAARSRTTPQASPTPTSIPGVPKGFNLYTNGDGTFSFIYPQGWTSRGTQAGGTGKEFDGPAGQLFTATNEGFVDLTPDEADNGFCLGFAGTTGPTQTVMLDNQKWTRKECDSLLGKKSIIEAVTYKGALYFMAYASTNDTFDGNRKMYFTAMEQSFAFLM